VVVRLQHPNVVQTGEHDGLPFFSMELCPGGGLNRKLKQGRPAVGEAVALVEALAGAAVGAAAGVVLAVALGVVLAFVQISAALEREKAERAKAGRLLGQVEAEKNEADRLLGEVKGREKRSRSLLARSYFECTPWPSARTAAPP
jgi:hypothetical protein